MSNAANPDGVESATEADVRDLPFRRLKVLDLSQGLAGPYCGALLAQHGATVVKVEPLEGDWSRGIGMRHGSHSAIDLMANRGKQSMAVDLKNPQAVAMVRRMAAQCDVLIESYRPGIAERLGLGYAALSEANRRLIYLSISGFGQTGSRAALPATDTVMQGFSGMMALNPDADGKPRRLGFLAVDTVTALYAFNAVSVALYARVHGAGGKHLDISLMQATAALLTPKIVEASLEGESPKATNVPAGVYRTADGWIAITLSKEVHYAALCKATGSPQLAQDPRFGSFVLRSAHASYLEAAFGELVRQQTTGHWLATFAQQGVLASKVNTVSDWLAEAHVQASGAAPLVRDKQAGEFRFPATPGVAAPEANESRAQWPEVGAHADQVLHAFGFDSDEIATLKAARALL